MRVHRLYIHAALSESIQVITGAIHDTHIICDIWHEDAMHTPYSDTSMPMQGHRIQSKASDEGEVYICADGQVQVDMEGGQVYCHHCV